VYGGWGVALGDALPEYAQRTAEQVAMMETLAAKLPRYGYRRAACGHGAAGLESESQTLLGSIGAKDYWSGDGGANGAPRRRYHCRPVRINQAWSMDYTHDQLASGRRFRTLNIVDEVSRESPAIGVDTSSPGARVVRMLERLAEARGYPERIVTDHRREFTGLALASSATSSSNWFTKVSGTADHFFLRGQYPPLSDPQRGSSNTPSASTIANGGTRPSVTCVLPNSNERYHEPKAA